jgi:hypothetical protein
MRRIVFVVLIVIVVIVVSFYTFLEFRTNEIIFESDVVSSWDYGASVMRVYRAVVDVDTFISEAENSLITAAFTDEELYAAALASGIPEFCPTFRFDIYNPDTAMDVFNFVASVKMGLHEDQKTHNFMLSDLSLEVITDGAVITDVELKPEVEHEELTGRQILSADGRTLAINLANISDYSLTLTGFGSVRFQYTYNIVTGGLFTRPVLEEQILIVHANISRGANGELLVEYINEPFSSIEDYMG